MSDCELLALCPIGAEAVCNNELKHSGFKMTEKFPGRLFFSLLPDSEVQNILKDCGREDAAYKKLAKKKLIGVRGNFSAPQAAARLPVQAAAKVSAQQEPKSHSGRVKRFGTSANGSERDSALYYSLLTANMHFRLVDRVGLVAAKFRCENFDDLFEGVRTVDWQSFFPKDARVVVDKVSVWKSKLASEHAVQSVTAKAIFSKLCSVWRVQRLEQSGQQFTIRVYLDYNTARVVVDTSGEALYKRGYRLAGGLAPMRETTAALLLQLALWKRKLPVHDCFCGSGTIPVEAMLYAHNVPAGLLRSFAFQNFTQFAGYKDGFLQYKAGVLKRIAVGNEVRISGSDIDPSAVSLSQANAEHAARMVEAEMKKVGITGTLMRPQFTCCAVSDLVCQYDTGLLIGNPPYGERLGDEQAAFNIYESIAKTARKFVGWQKGFITTRPEFLAIQQKYTDARIDVHSIKSGKFETCFYQWQG